jgi:hypothetical protein
MVLLHGVLLLCATNSDATHAILPMVFITGTIKLYLGRVKKGWKIQDQFGASWTPALRSTDLIQIKGTYPYHKKIYFNGYEQLTSAWCCIDYKQDICKLTVNIHFTGHLGVPTSNRSWLMVFSFYCHMHTPMFRYLFLGAFAKIVY